MKLAAITFFFASVIIFITVITVLAVADFSSCAHAAGPKPGSQMWIWQHGNSAHVQQQAQPEPTPTADAPEPEQQPMEQQPAYEPPVFAYEMRGPFPPPLYFMAPPPPYGRHRHHHRLQFWIGVQ